METLWHFTTNGQIAPAPIPFTELRRRFLAGEVKPTDLVGADGMSHWQVAGAIEGLMPIPWRAASPSASPDAARGGGSASPLLAAGAGAAVGLGLGALAAHAMTGSKRAAGAGVVADTASLHGLRVRVQQLHVQGLISDEHFSLLADLITRAEAGPAARPLSRIAKRRLASTPRRSGQSHGANEDATDAEDAETKDDAEATDSSDDDEILDAESLSDDDADGVLDAEDLGDDAYEDDDDMDDAENDDSDDMTDDEDDALDDDLDSLGGDDDLEDLDGDLGGDDDDDGADFDTSDSNDD